MVLQAPPGAGKTTVVPIVASGVLAAGLRVLVVAPRRIAAKAAARRMAGMLGTPVGQDIGYAVRLDSKYNSGTSVIVITPGVMLKWLQEDSIMSAVGAILFDEFHERGAEGDLGLSLALDIQRHTNRELRIVVMSATLGTELVQQVATFLSAAHQAASAPKQKHANGLASPQASREVLSVAVNIKGPESQRRNGYGTASVPVIVSEGRSFDVQRIYLSGPSGSDPRAFTAAVASAVQQALKDTAKDILVFLPGMREIRAVQGQLSARSALPGNAESHILHGDLPMEAQDALLAPHHAGKRRVILATSIAESSITLPGVTAVVDSGMARQPAFDPRSDLWRLETVPISLASADQRAGRAGRVAPGTCYRLWSESAHAQLEASPKPGMYREDLTPLALNLASLGPARAARLQWLDAPSGATMAAAHSLLSSLGAISADGSITALAIGQMEEDADLVGVLVAVAYPDRLGMRRDSSNRSRPATYLMANGAMARLAEVGDPLGTSPMVAVADVGGHTHRGAKNDTIHLAAPLSVEAVQLHLPHMVEEEDVTTWNEGTKAVERSIRQRIGTLTLKDTRAPVSDDAAAEVIIAMLRKAGMGALPLSKQATALLNRLRWLAAEHNAQSPSAGGERWPDVSHAALEGTLDEWLLPWLVGVRSMADLKALDWSAALRSLVPPSLLRTLDTAAPEKWTSPTTGASFALDYTNSLPLLPAPIAAFFGPLDIVLPSFPSGVTASSATPPPSDSPPASMDLDDSAPGKRKAKKKRRGGAADGGTVQQEGADQGAKSGLTLVLLSPRRSELGRVPAKQLAHFWTVNYPAVRLEFVRRYKRHNWPADPTQPEPVPQSSHGFTVQG
ncbi:hypothetical protein WJX73_003698 [Symbiochloris irregularis]|uniref:ATP-dependent helicase HrpB n=1 Tax=Symbiochloris irregularis TaxID=706552 RepID=A0AAW1P2F0_9CHLO